MLKEIHIIEEGKRIASLKMGEGWSGQSGAWNRLNWDDLITDSDSLESSLRILKLMGLEVEAVEESEE